MRATHTTLSVTLGNCPEKISKLSCISKSWLLSMQSPNSGGVRARIGRMAERENDVNKKRLKRSRRAALLSHLPSTTLLVLLDFAVKSLEDTRKEKKENGDQLEFVGLFLLSPNVRLRRKQVKMGGPDQAT